MSAFLCINNFKLLTINYLRLKIALIYPQTGLFNLDYGGITHLNLTII